jgi:hypothetical protein
MHPRIADRIASVLAAVQRTKGREQAQKWWAQRWAHMTKGDYDEVVTAMNRRAGKAR